MHGGQVEQPAAKAMPRYVAIDGLRAWLAWIVVATHIVQQALPDGGGARWIKLDLGGEAVNTFIIISGFVITHLLIERPTRYAAYIVPRFMRLFPGFLACCTIGGLSYAAGARWADPAWFAAVHGYQFGCIVDYLPLQILAHLTLLHGIIPNTVLPLSEYAFSPPGWSVSLEWQFYLLAPLAVWACRSRNRAVVLVLCVAALSFLYHAELKPLWDRPSFLAGSTKFFLIGIASRFAAPALAGLVSHVAAIGLGLGFSLVWIGSPSVALWAVVYSFMLQRRDVIGAVDRGYVRAMRAALESRPAQLLADRSYSTYLLHWSVIMSIGTLATRWGIVPGPRLMMAMCLAFPLVLAMQEPLYRYVEMPGRNLGRRWARWLAAGPANEVPEESVTISPSGRRRTT